MSAPVDVLAVMDRLIGNARTMAGLTGDLVVKNNLREGEQARDAVADLIEADREFDAAADALAAAKREKGNWRVNPLGNNHPAVIRMREAKARRTAALARVGGGA